MAFRFSLERVTRDPSGYYQTRWDRATPLSIIADSEPEARKKAKEMSGPMYGGRSGDVWTFRVVRIDEIHESEEEQQ